MFTTYVPLDRAGMAGLLLSAGWVRAGEDGDVGVFEFIPANQ